MKSACIDTIRQTDRQTDKQAKNKDDSITSSAEISVTDAYITPGL